METFRKKQPVDYEDPYHDMLADIRAIIKLYEEVRKHIPNYIIINTKDYELLMAASKRAKLLPQPSTDLVLIQSARVMPSTAMPAGHFDVVGN